MISNGSDQNRNTFWSTVSKLDKSKINSWIALRNALAVAIPIGLGIEFGHASAGVATATGALNVSYSDGNDPYAQRGLRMLTWSLLGACAVFLGSVTGYIPWLAILVTAVWAFIAGLLIAVSTRAADLGLNTLVAMIVFGARGASSPMGAFETALLALAGGLLQASFALLLWPVRRYDPERRAIGAVYLKLAKALSPHSPVPAPSPLENASSETQDAIDSLGRDHSIEGERFRLLFDQADRVRMSAFLLGRLTLELEHQQRKLATGFERLTESAERLLTVASELLASVGTCLLEPDCAYSHSQLLTSVDEATQNAREFETSPGASLGADVAYAMDVLAGQLRLIAELAARSLPEGAQLAARNESRQPWKLRFGGWLNTLRANLDPKSAVCRHAIRLAVCVSIGNMISRGIGWQRSYWIPMTVAVVLKPDFTTTFSRGVLRLAGTSVGLALATLLYHIFPPTPLLLVLLVGTFTLMLRSLGPANYGIFSVAISGLIVFLIAVTGIAPATVVVQREINTLAGGLFALLAYVLWPTWEHTQVREAIAEMLDVCRAYFRAVARRLSQEDASLTAELDRLRVAWSRARTNAEASVDRLSSEPNPQRARLDDLYGMLASSSALAHTIIGLEAGFIKIPARAPLQSFLKFSNDVEFTLYFLAAALRGSSASNTFPKLREDHTHLVQASRASPSEADKFLLIETDRLTVSLNTLREQITRYLT